MTRRSTSNFWLLSMVCLVLLSPRRVEADALASCSLTFSNLTIAPSAGTVVYDGPWTAESFVQAQNSLGELNQQYVSTNGATATADAAATYATGHGDASPLTLAGTASGSSIIPGSASQQAISEGQPDVYNSFTITGGTGTVNVAFSVALSGMLSVITDSYGSNAVAETIFNLTLDGSSILFSDTPLSVGPNSTNVVTVSATLTNTVALQYGTDYFVFAQPDAETMAVTVPEPSTFALILAGCLVLAGAARKTGRRKRGTSNVKKRTHSLCKCLWMSILPVSVLLCPTSAHAKYAGGGGNPPPPGVTTMLPGPPGSGISLTDGNLTEWQPISSIKCPTCGACPPCSSPVPTHGVKLNLTYNSDNADGSRTQLDTGLGYGWTHSYNIFLFSQVGSMFRYDGTGGVTKYTRGPGGKYVADTGYFETLIRNPNGTYTITDKFGTAFTFASIPNTPFLVGGPVYRLTSIVDRNGDSNTLSYASGNLTSVSDTYGRSLTLAYNSSNKVVSVTDPLSRTTTFMYDSTGRKLTTITDPEGKTTQYSYNFMYQMTEMVDQDGRTTRFLYAGGKPSLMMDSAFQKWFGLNNSSNWAMNTNALSQDQLRRYAPSTTTESDGRGNLWNYTYDSNGYITNTVTPDGATTSYSYDPATLGLSSRTDPDGNVTTYQYDSLGNRTNVTDTLTNVTSYTYETNFNEVTSMTDPKGRVTTYQYDAHGNRTSQIDPLGETNSWSYDTHGNVLTETDKNGNTTTYQYDSFGNRTNVTDALSNVTALTYDAVGNQLSRTDANGHATTYQYDSLDRLIKQIDPVGAFDQYAYDAQGNRTNVVDRDGDATMYQYDLRQRLVTTTDALGHISTVTYDDNNNRTSMTDQNSHTTAYQYDVQNRPTQVTDALGNTTITGYDPAGNVLSTTDANGHVTTTTYDALNRRIAMTDAAGDVTRYQYDTGGSSGCGSCGVTPGSSLLTGETDADGNVTYFKYDNLDRLTNTVLKVGSTNDTITVNDAVTTYTYDANNNRVSLTEPDGNTTLYHHDALNRPTNTVNAAGDVTTILYDGVGNVTSNIAPNGNVTVYTYDALDRRTNTVDSMGPMVSHTYDAMGNRLSQTDGNGNTTMYAYDAIDRLVTTTDPLGKTTVRQYDPVGNLLMSTDRNGNATTYVYDSINRRTSMTDALGNTTQYQYDPVGNRLQITDANGHTTQYQYDPVNRLTQETYADATTRTYSYDAVGNLSNRTDQIGQTTTYVYDDLHRLTQRTYPSGTNDAFAYDLSGRMTNSTRGAWVVTYAYDGANRLTNTAQNGQTIAYGYDIPGRTLTNTYPGGRTTIHRMDYRGRKTQIDDSSSPPSIAQYTYDAGNRVISRTNRNATVTTYNYNANDWPVSVAHSNATALIAGFGYAYDNEGNKQYEENGQNTAESQCYEYDPIYQLTDYQVGTLVGTCVTGTVTQTQYDLDPLGNWTNKTTDAITQTRTHNSVNELTMIDATNLTYDANGNLLDDAIYAYTYDEENRLTSVTRLSDSAVVGQYQYDAMGRRVQKVANPNGSPTTTRYFHDNVRILEEQDGLGNTLATYVYGNYVDEVLTMDRGGQTYYYHPNALWSVEAITDSTGTNVVERYRYDAYGAPTVTDPSGLIVSTNSWGTSHSVITNSYLFTGRQLEEETGLYFYRARYYDSVKGRFLQRDPLDYVDDGLNLYEYARSNPIRYTDFSGRDCAEGVCGPDITDALLGSIRSIFKIWNQASAIGKSHLCSPSAGFLGWDIWELHDFSKNGERIGAVGGQHCARGGVCARSVMVGGQCFQPGAVNYVMYGLMANLCNYSYLEMVGSIFAYKPTASNRNQSIEWASQGYYALKEYANSEPSQAGDVYVEGSGRWWNGWLRFRGLGVPFGDYTQKCSACNDKKTGKLLSVKGRFQVNWGIVPPWAWSADGQGKVYPREF